MCYKPLSDNIEYVKNTMEIEGFEITEEDVKWLEEIENNHYTREQVLKMVKEKYWC